MELSLWKRAFLRVSSGKSWVTPWLCGILALCCGACSTVPTTLHVPQNVVRFEGQAEMGPFIYRPYAEGTVDNPNKIQQIGLDYLLLTQDVGEFARRITGLELEKSGVKLAVTAPTLISGEVVELLVDSVGFTLEWSYIVRYQLNDKADGRLLHDRAYGPVVIKTSKPGVFTGFEDYSSLVTELVLSGYDRFSRDADVQRLLSMRGTPVGPDALRANAPYGAGSAKVGGTLAPLTASPVTTAYTAPSATSAYTAPGTTSAYTALGTTSAYTAPGTSGAYTAPGTSGAYATGATPALHSSYNSNDQYVGTDRGRPVEPSWHFKGLMPQSEWDAYGKRPSAFAVTGSRPFDPASVPLLKITPPTRNSDKKVAPRARKPVAANSAVASPAVSAKTGKSATPATSAASKGAQSAGNATTAKPAGNVGGAVSGAVTRGAVTPASTPNSAPTASPGATQGAVRPATAPASAPYSGAAPNTGPAPGKGPSPVVNTVNPSN